jgi:hypothetical protein
MASVWEWIHRTSLIPAYIRRTQPGRVVRSALALELDRSEKVGVSYAMGQAMTNIFCERLLSAHFLMHIDRYASRFGVTFSATRKRADLFGPDRGGDWMVAEAKGRSNSMESGLKLIDQKRSISLIAGSPPRLAIGCVASFPPYARTLEIDAFDPEEDEAEAIQLDVNPDLYLLAYYEPFIAAVDFGDAVDAVNTDEQILIAAIPQAGLRVGILRSVASRIRTASRGTVEGLADSIWPLLEQQYSSAGFPDGTVVETNWEDQILLNDWESYG